MRPLTTTDHFRSRFLPMGIIGGLFFIFGFITWLNGALIPFLQIVCQLTETQALLIAFSFYIAYVVMALPMAWVMDRTGYKQAMALGVVMISIGFLLFIPAAHSQLFTIFLFAQFVVGSGLTILQTASNPYIVKIGPKETAAVRISIMGLLNKLAGVIAPLVFTALVLGNFQGITTQSIMALPADQQVEQINHLSNALIKPYFGLAMVLLVLAYCIKRSSLPELELEKTSSQDADVKTSIFQFPQLTLGMLTLFMYVGVEVIAGDTIGLFGSKLGVENATSLTSYTMFFMVMGYLLGLVLIPRVIKQQSALTASALLGIVISLLVVNSDPNQSNLSEFLWGWLGIPLLPNTVTLIALLGLANALVWPAVWPLALDGLGSFTARGAALLIMGIAGGAILPLLYGTLTEYVGGQDAYWIMLPCYLFILFYAIKGHKLR